jgi:hypothetical protein
MGAIKDALAYFGLTSLTPQDVLFLTGAGISAPDPTGFTLGDELHRLVLENFTSLAPKEVVEVFAKKIPFEQSCEIISQAFSMHPLSHGVNVFWNLVSELLIWRSSQPWKQPNELHRYFREHIQNGGKHITANLDQFIELDEIPYFVITTKAIDADPAVDLSSGILRLYKFHGDCNNDYVGEQGFVLSAIQQGFTANARQAWEQFLDSAKLLVVCGYSGLDRYDVNQYFASLPDARFRARILWIDYAEQALSPVSSSANPDINVILSKFRMSRLLKGRPGDALNDLQLPFSRIANMTRSHLRPECRDHFRCNTAPYATDPDFINCKNQAAAAIAALP